jgi:recombination protein RecT
MADNQLATTGKPSVQAYLRNDVVKKRIDEMLGKRSPQFITALMAATNNIAHLGECTPASVLNAALTVAALDLPINNNLGFAYMIPYKNKGVYEAQFQMGWKGFIQLAQRSGQYKTIAATPVYEGQLISADPLLGNKFDWTKKTNDKIIGYVAQFQLMNGFSKDLYMTMEEVKAHANRFSQSYRSGYDSPWKSDFDAMAQKTVIKMLVSKFGPMSIDPQMQMAVEKDQAIIEEGGVIEFPDNTPEIEDTIAEIESTEDLEAYLQTLTVDDRKKVTGAVNNRVKELATQAKLKGEADAKAKTDAPKTPDKQAAEAFAGTDKLSDKDKAEIEADEKKAADAFNNAKPTDAENRKAAAEKAIADRKAAK